MRLFDASALVEVLLDGNTGRSAVPFETVFDEHVLDLTFYEAGNALWNIGIRHDHLSTDEVQDAVDALGRLGRDVVTESVATLDFGRTMTVAREEGLTFYDTAYLVVAERDDLMLVSDDRALREAATARDIDTEATADLAG